MALTKVHDRMIVGAPANVKDFGAVGDGTTDDTAAIQAAIDSYSSGQGVVFFPKGRYLVTSTLSITKDRVHLEGEAPWVSRILFNPTAEDICIFIGKGGEGSTDGGVIFQNSIKKLTFESTDETTKKTAIELKDISTFVAEDIVVGSTDQWIGSGSIGVRIRGREGSVFTRMTISCNRPFVFAKNDAFPSLSLDQFHFQDIFTFTRGHVESTPVYDETHFFFEPGTNFSNVTFDGMQAYVRGKNAFYYDNSTEAAAGASYQLRIVNPRWEGEPGDDDTGHFFYLVHGSTSEAQQVSIENAYFGEVGNGLYLRDIREFSISDSSFISNSREALNIATTSGLESVEIKDCFFQTGCTATIPDDFTLYSSIKTPNASVLPRSGIFHVASGGGRNDFVTGGPINQKTISIAATDPTVVTLPIDDTASVFLMLTDSRGKVAIVAVNSASNTTTLVHNDGTFSTTQGTASKLNVYYDSGSTSYKLENKTGTSRDLYVQAFGSNR